MPEEEPRTHDVHTEEGSAACTKANKGANEGHIKEGIAASTKGRELEEERAEDTKNESTEPPREGCLAHDAKAKQVTFMDKFKMKLLKAKLDKLKLKYTTASHESQSTVNGKRPRSKPSQQAPKDDVPKVKPTSKSDRPLCPLS